MKIKIVSNFLCISYLYIQLILFVEVLSRLLVVYLIPALYISNIVNIMFILFQGVLENIRGSVGSGEKSGKKLDQSLKTLVNVKFLLVLNQRYIFLKQVGFFPLPYFNLRCQFLVYLFLSFRFLF